MLGPTTIGRRRNIGGRLPGTAMKRATANMASNRTGTARPVALRIIMAARVRPCTQATAIAAHGITNRRIHSLTGMGKVTGIPRIGTVLAGERPAEATAGLAKASMPSTAARRTVADRHGIAMI